MKSIKKVLCLLFALLMIPLTGCDLFNGEKYKLNIKDLHSIILNIDEICESNKTYGLYKKGDEITFEIQFFSGLSATLSIDETIYRPTGVKAWETEYIKYTMPDHDVSVVSLINGYVGDEVNLCETLEWGFNITDESLDYIDVQIKYLGVAPENEYGETARVYNEDYFISNWFHNAQIREQDYEITGGAGYIVTFVLNNKESYILNIMNKYVFANGETYYMSSGVPYFITSLF